MQMYKIDIAPLLISHRHLSQVCQERPIRGPNVAIKEIASDRKKNLRGIKGQKSGEIKIIEIYQMPLEKL